MCRNIINFYIIETINHVLKKRAIFSKTPWHDMQLLVSVTEDTLTVCKHTIAQEYCSLTHNHILGNF